MENELAKFTNEQLRKAYTAAMPFYPDVNPNPDQPLDEVEGELENWIDPPLVFIGDVITDAREVGLELVNRAKIDSIHELNGVDILLEGGK